MNRTMIVVSSTVSILSALLCLPVMALPKKAQMLPIEAQTTLKGKTIQLEVARTVEQQATGLMFRTELAEDRGMIFLFNPPTPINFWMKNTLIPLDMVFTHSGKVVYLQRNAPPCKTLDRLKLNVADPITVEFSKTVKTRALKPGAPRAIRPL
jgi:uncharacterized membrane protein (UPF0127 family)